MQFLPELVDRIGSEEQACRSFQRLPLLARPVAGAIGASSSRAVACAATCEVAAVPQHVVGGAPAPRRARLRTAASSYIDARLGATRRVVEFSAFEQLFSLWHALHMPLFVMLLIAGVVHVVAVHVY